MPRANRYILPGHIYHLTHRCHGRQFLLKFAKDRNAYCRRLLRAARALDVSADPNMVRCGMVKHPSQWNWTGYAELMGHKKRNRVLNLTKLLELLGCLDISEFRPHYEKLVMERLEKDWMKREAHWTESLAVEGNNSSRTCSR